MDHATRLARVFVELADTLVEGFDVVDFLQTLTDRCVDLLHTDASGLMLSHQRGGLEVMTATLERARVLELFELQVQEGPCLDCYTSGAAISNVDLAGPVAEQRWPRFTPAAVEAGFGTTHALPMRLRGRVIGALNLFSNQRIRLSEDDLEVGQAMADVATIGLLNQHHSQEQTILTGQLQTALDSRVLIEQAKGALGARTGVNVDEAFRMLRGYARRTNQTLTDVAVGVVEQMITVDAFATAPNGRVGPPRGAHDDRVKTT